MPTGQSGTSQQIVRGLGGMRLGGLDPRLAGYTLESGQKLTGSHLSNDQQT